jgi:hypothetical protein
MKTKILVLVPSWNPGRSDRGHGERIAGFREHPVRDERGGLAVRSVKYEAA